MIYVSLTLFNYNYISNLTDSQIIIDEKLWTKTKKYGIMLAINKILGKDYSKYAS